MGEVAVATRAGPAAARLIRAEYAKQIAAIVTKAEEGVAAGRSVESVAREAVEARNALKLAERAAGPWWIARMADLRNLVIYRNRAGPTADQLFQETGSWEKVLEKVGRTNVTIDRLSR